MKTHSHTAHYYDKFEIFNFNGREIRSDLGNFIGNSITLEG